MPYLWYSACHAALWLITVLIFITEGHIPCFRELTGAADHLNLLTYPFPSNYKKPMCPQDISTVFKLYTRENRQGVPIGVVNNKLNTTLFKRNKQTKIISHGYLQGADVKPIVEIKKEFLDKMDVNVITVDWRKGCTAVLDYERAVVNTWVVGVQLANLLYAMTKQKLITPAHVHVIGFSLGAHVAGYAGDRIPGLGRITGLDPARMLFANMPPNRRLDRNDAVFVDIIHTDTTEAYFIPTHGYGMKQPCGDVDFYPNGEGNGQPGCQHYFLERPGCDHMRSYGYFLETLRSWPNCSFHAHLCDSYDDFGTCTLRNGEDNYSANMGIDAVKYSKKLNLSKWPRKFYLKTNCEGKFSMSRKCANL